VSAIILWRHAPTPNNLDGVIQGSLDVSLDETGRARAAWAASHIAALYGDPVIPREVAGDPVIPREVAGNPVIPREVAGDPVIPREVAGSAPALRVFSSPLVRARETAAALTSLVGGDVLVDQAFTQRSYGAWEGLTWDEVKRDFPDEFARRQRGLDPRISGWDGQRDVAARVLEGLERIWDEAKPAVVVSHGSPITLGLLAAIGEPASSVVLGRVPHAAWAVVRRVESGAWHIEHFGLGAD